MKAVASIPSEAMMHFPPVSDFTPISQKGFGLRGKCPHFDLFSKISRFSFAKIYHKFLIAPYFPVSIHFPSIPGKFFFPLLMQNFPPDFVKLTCFTYNTRISFPPTFTMMHLCITQCTYWTPMSESVSEVQERTVQLGK